MSPLPLRPARTVRRPGTPPPTLPGLDPAWSRHVTAPDAEGHPRRWHVLEVRPTGPVQGTVLCVHGNPTWSYLWRRVLASAPAGWRVVAVDQLGMGYSEHPAGSLAAPRTLAQRGQDLDALTAELGLDSGPVVAVGHDWGGIMAAGWAIRHPDVLAGLVLTNTALHHDFARGLPMALRPARSRTTLAALCVHSPAFVRAAALVSSPRPPRAVRDAYAAPYPSAASRSFVGQFVADIPLEDDHPSRDALTGIADAVAELTVPALLLWGPRDPVFGEAHLQDLRRRLPHAQVQRYEGAGHLVLEDAPTAPTDLWRWIDQRVSRTNSPAAARPPAPAVAVGTPEVPWQRLQRRAVETPTALAIAEVGTGRRLTFAALAEEVDQLARALVHAGIAPGERVALLVPPGIDLTIVVYACWRIGAVIVVADKGLGLTGMRRALRGAGPQHVIGTAAGLTAARAMGLDGQRLLVGAAPTPRARLQARLAAAHQDLVGLAATADLPPITHVPEGDDPCAVLFTSGATGPSKGVCYRVDALRGMIGHIGAAYALNDDDRLVAAFAPFALYGPALGIATVVPDIDVTAPASLTAPLLAEAAAALGATVVFASPAALRHVVATADDLAPHHHAALARIRVVLSAGAPVPVELLQQVQELMPQARAHTPYGMTEVLPVTEIAADDIAAAMDGPDRRSGVCVGLPLPEVEVAVLPFGKIPDDDDPGMGSPPDLTRAAGIAGEVFVRAGHMRDGYDQLWRADRLSSLVPGWHRTGDVGELDAAGRLWIQGRTVHVLHTAQGPLTPVGSERAAERVAGVQSACLVGVGPPGTQQAVVVLELEAAHRSGVRGPLAPLELTALIREAVPHPVAAVLVVAALPVDIRHQSKLDRSRVAAWAERVLAGGRVGAP